MSAPVVILGLGFTTRRLARRLLEQGVPVFAAVRGPERFSQLVASGARLCGLSAEGLPRQAVMVHSIPPLQDPERSVIHGLIAAAAPRRIVYISSTSVYGAQTPVCDSSRAEPNDEKGFARVAEEDWMMQTRQASPTGGGAHPWSSLILRSAGIYGPGRGIHVRLREGKMPRGGGRMVSRIHVDDLVELLLAAIDSPVEGAWPVADDLPAPSEEVAAWCAKLLGIPLPGETAPGFPVAGRSVDGKKIRELLGVTLKHPTYRTGIPACVAEEQEKRAGAPEPA